MKKVIYFLLIALSFSSQYSYSQEYVVEIGMKVNPYGRFDIQTNSSYFLYMFSFRIGNKQYFGNESSCNDISGLLMSSENTLSALCTVDYTGALPTGASNSRVSGIFNGQGFISIARRPNGFNIANSGEFTVQHALNTPVSPCQLYTTDDPNTDIATATSLTQMSYRFIPKGEKPQFVGAQITQLNLNTPFQLELQSGLPANWQYTLDDSLDDESNFNWVNIPFGEQTMEGLGITLADIPQSAKIRFRAVVCRSNGVYAYMDPITVIGAQVPDILGNMPTAVAPQCHYNGSSETIGLDGGFTATFIDEIGENRKLTYIVFSDQGVPGEFETEVGYGEFRQTDLDNNGTFTYNNPNIKLKPGDYRFKWMTGPDVQDDDFSIGDENVGKTSELFTIPNPNPIEISLFNQSPPTCAGEINGSITVNATGGSGSYKYVLIKEGGNNTESTTGNFTGVGTGNYVLQIEDSNECLLEINDIEITATSNSPTIDINDVLRNQLNEFPFGEASLSLEFVTINGGDGTNYDYSWTGPNGVIGDNNTRILTDLTDPGTYTLVISSGGCVSEPYDFIINPIPQLTVAYITIGEANCIGETVTINTNVTGGAGAYTYSWSNGEITSSINEAPGTYTLTVSDEVGNEIIENFTLNYINNNDGSIINELLSVNIVNTVDIVCSGTNTGIIELNIEGGVAPYEVYWDGILSVANRNDFSVGDHNYIVRDSNGCEVSNITPINITQPPNALEVSGSSTNVTVNGYADGTIELIILNGTEPYQFSWWIQEVGGVQEIDGNFYNPYTPTQDINPLLFDGFSAGTYQVIVTDGTTNACTAMLSSPIIINQPGPLTINDEIAIVSDVACFGESTGRIDASYEGTEPFIFVWLDENDNVIQTGARDFIENLPEGDYSYTVNDASNAGPLASGNITITEPIALTARLDQIDGITCFGNDGRIVVSASGGTAPYRYIVTEGNAIEQPTGSGIFTNLEADNYIINVLDANDCEIPAPLAIELVAPAQITFDDTDAITPITTPNGSDGSISVAIEGGVQPYYYSWTGNGVTTPINTVNTTTIENLPEGTYTLTVSNNENFSPNDCYFSKSYTITEQDEFSIAPLTGTPTICFDQNNGSITATVEATGLVTYIWRLEDGTVISTIPDSELQEITLDNLEDGSYYLEATNENTTITSDIFTIDRLPEITATILTTRTCFGGNTGTILFTDPVGSPSGSFLYSIDNGATTQTTPLFEGLPEGIYSPRLSTEEYANCDFITNEVNILASPALFYDQPNTIITRASGPGANDGAISVAVQGGTPPFTYVLDGGTPQDTNVFNNLSEGSYEITITDSAGCMEPAIIEVTEIGPLTISNILPNDALCRNEANGSITTTVTGEGRIIYSWRLADRSPVPVSNGVNTQNLEGILAGDYILTVTDEITTVTSEVISVGEPATSLTILDIISTDISCFNGSDGSIEIQADGGTGNYTYSINGIDFQPEPIFEGLEANSYSVSVRDENFCEFQEPTLVALIAPAALNIAVTEPIPTSAANASDGAIYITPEGGSDSYTYLWSGPNGFTSNEQDITNLEAGTYTVIITDANYNSNNDAGCQFISEDIVVTEPGQLVVTINQTEFIACSGDSSAEIVANVQGGVLPYTYQWYEYDNGNEILLEEETDIIANLPYGTYYLIATDDNDISVESNRIVITQPNLLEITVDDVTNVICSGESTGAINITVSGGTPPYQYYWSNAETLPNINGLEAGEYTIEVEDSEGCIATQSIVVASPNEVLEITESILTNASDYQVNDGSIAIEVTGGQEPYTYTWIQSSTNAVISNAATISNLSADTYTVIISDVYDCDLTEIYEITQPDIIEETILQPSCFGNTDGSINLLVNQGNGVFTYQWSSGEATNTLNNLGAGTYTVTVTGLSDGPITRSYTLENPNPIDVNLGIDRVLCADQTLELDATVDDESATYTWTSDNGFTSTSPLVVLNITGNYTVTVETENGCTAQGSIRVDVSNDEIDAEFAMSSQVFVGETAVAVDLSYPLPDGIEWIVPLGAEVVTQNQDEVEFAFAEAGEYEITLITTKGNCIAEQTKKIIVIPTDNLIQEDSSNDGQKVVEEFICYPNPTIGVFSVGVNLTEEGDVSIKIFNMVSNTLIASERERGQTNYTIPFDISGVPTGVYAVVLETPYGTSLQKVIVR